MDSGLYLGANTGCDLPLDIYVDDKNPADDYRITPLHRAAQSGYIEK